MKKSFNFLLILCVALIAVSCNANKTYTDMLNNQKDAISKLIDDENIEVLKDYPADSVFKENQFVILDNGVYLNVIDPGDKQRAVSYKTDILVRFTAVHFMTDTVEVSNYGPHSNGTLPVEFIYGYATAKTTPSMTNFDYALSQYFMSEGLQSGLKMVGNNAKVKLIVPFQIGSETDNTAGAPVYYKILEYKFSD